MNRNDSPRLTNKLYELLKDIVNNKGVLEKYTPEFLENLQIDEESYVKFLQLYPDFKRDY